MGAPPQNFSITISAQLDYNCYHGRSANLFRHNHQKELFVATKDMYMGQFIYCGHRVTPPIGDALPLCKTFEGATICDDEHHTGDCGTPPPGHPGTMPSSATATPTMAPEQEAPPTVARPQRTTARLTMSGTLQYSSFGGSEFFMAKAARTTSSTLDDL